MSGQAASGHLELGVEAEQARVFPDEARHFAEVEEADEKQELAQRELSQSFVVACHEAKHSC